MANIVNSDVPSLDEQVGHDKTNHVSLKELYDYNETMTQLIALVKDYKGYITDIREHWKNAFQNADEHLNQCDCINHVNCILEYKSSVDMDDELLPDELYSSLMQIIPPYDTCYSEKAAKEMLNIFHKYIKMQYFPLVAMVPTEQDLMMSFEKYDDTVGAHRVIGTILDVYSKETDIGVNLYAVILWNPNLKHYSEASFITANSLSGYLTMSDMIKTPKCWYNSETCITNFGVPIFSYVPGQMFSSIVRSCTALQNAISSDLANDQYHLEYTDILEANFKKSIANMVDHMNNRDNKSGEPNQEKVTKSIPIEEEVPVEDARDDDRLGHLLHLYDDYSDIKGDDIPDDDIPENVKIDYADRFDNFGREEDDSDSGIKPLPINGIRE